ncbi:ATP-grasp domain-containing protein [Chryseobacterium oryctis]|uniref:ATP-grasp domain-containing protein n=1 Tax=Chryseobacterium oryctis TaxID=2952618 RepID=A0ABT3HLJ3_9FLAO|nr:ATP-grasp domain-containing protein [Chryseobacterium oryctis]MCW3160646.1 ATP-grasp domain-containing protein [Chryseobacterium oryctis]
MKAYIQTNKSGEFYNVNAFVAFEGFKNFGYEIEKFVDAHEISDNNPENIVVGGIGNIRKRLQNLNIRRPDKEIDYPEELKSFLKRNIWESTINQVFADKSSWNIFIKPKTETKLFAGKVIQTEMDFLGIINEEKDIEVLCSELIDFKTEWRCFIRYKEILDIRRYKGDWDTKIDLKTIVSAINSFTSQPNSYALDFGVNEKGETILVEVNDGHSLGTYGLSSSNYAKFLSARWSELTQTEDYLNF